MLVSSPTTVDGAGNGSASDRSDGRNGNAMPPAVAPASPRRVAATRRRLVVGGALGLVGLIVLGGAALLASDSDALEAGAVRSNAVVFVDPPDRELVSQTPAEGRPVGVAVGDDAVWVTDASTGEVLRLSPVTREIEDRIPVPGDPGDIAVGGGSVWVVSTQDGAVSEINPSAHSVVGTVRIGNGPTAIAYGAGAVWVADATDGTVTRVDPGRAEVAETIRIEQPLDDIAVGYGAVWVTSAASGLLVRIDPRTDRVTDSLSVGNGPSSIALAGGGVWVSNPPDGTVSASIPRPVSSARSRSTPRARSPPPVARSGSAETQRLDLAIVDPLTGSISDRVATGSPATAIAASEETVALVTGAHATAHAGGTLRVVAEGGLDSIDPGQSWSLFGWEMLSMTHAGLVTYARKPGPAGSSIVPDLATSVPAPQDGGRTYTFQLRPDLQLLERRPGDGRGRPSVRRARVRGDQRARRARACRWSALRPVRGHPKTAT